MSMTSFTVIYQLQLFSTINWNQKQAEWILTAFWNTEMQMQKSTGKMSLLEPMLPFHADGNAQINRVMF